jgi:hypothetical protein
MTIVGEENDGKKMMGRCVRERESNDSKQAVKTTRRQRADLFKHMEHVQQPKYANQPQQSKDANDRAAPVFVKDHHRNVKRQPTDQIHQIFEFLRPPQSLLDWSIFFDRVVWVS